jgi:hypothetical protein
MVPMTTSFRSVFAATATLLVCVLAGMPRAAQTGPRETAASGARAHQHLSLFTHSENCLACHNNLQAPSGEDVSIGSTWRSTMMANSGRDPYWQASVRRETLDHPAQSATIQDDCAACHMPMLAQIAHAGEGEAGVLAELPIARQDPSPLHRLAADGVSCTVCHQISNERLGSQESFNGGFVLKPTPPDGTRVIFGPYRIDAGRKTIMRSVTGFVQAQGEHIRQSELCASCHTLVTTALGTSGEAIGALHEQMNFQEWQHSDFEREERGCQSCHMPKAPGPVRIASTLGDARDSLSRHLFVGGNAFVVRMLNRYRTDLGVDATSAELEATARATVHQLQTETATVAISPPQLSAGTLAFDVDVRNLSGHKYPTGYPARRTWLHVIVRDAQGRTQFESGAIGQDGAIAGNDNDADARRLEPHYETISSPEQVQIYESILGDRNRTPTTGLLTATQYLKDNRLLPRGFDKATAKPEIGVVGGAMNDATFAGGGDRVRYEAKVSGAGPFTVDVELRYQPIGYRWAHNLESYAAAETTRFVAYYNAMSADASLVVAKAGAATGPASLR